MREIWGLCHDFDVDMSAEAEGARLLAGVEEEGLDEVSFLCRKSRGFVLQFSPLSA